jgi:hypothetical protein
MHVMFSTRAAIEKIIWFVVVMVQWEHFSVYDSFDTNITAYLWQAHLGFEINCDRNLLTNHSQILTFFLFF